MIHSSIYIIFPNSIQYIAFLIQLTPLHWLLHSMVNFYHCVVVDVGDPTGRLPSNRNCELFLSLLRVQEVVHKGHQDYHSENGLTNVHLILVRISLLYFNVKI